MTLSRRRSLPALLALGLAGGLVAGAPSPASAAWQTTTFVHDARLQVCTTPGPAGPAVTVRVRLDNRDARHAHVGGFTRTRQGEPRYVSVRARAGRISAARQVSVRPKDALSSSISDTDGVGAGGGVGLAGIPRC